MVEQSLSKIQLYRKRYRLRSQNNRSFYTWPDNSEELLENVNWSWSEMFDSDPYFKIENVFRDEPYLSIPILSYRIAENEIKSKYRKFVDKLKPSDPPSLSNISVLYNYKSMVHSYLKEQMDVLEKIDTEVLSVLKVFYYEAEIQVDDFEEVVTFPTRESNIKFFYRNGIRLVCKPEYIENNFFPLGLEFVEVDEEIKKSTLDGLMYYVERKDVIIKNLLSVYEKFIFLQSIIGQVLRDESIRKAKPEKAIKQTNRNLKQELKEEGLKNLSNKETLIKVAKKIIFDEGTGDLSNYFGEKGWPKKILWNHDKVNTLNIVIQISTRKKWLKDAYQEGKFDKPANGQLTAS